MGSKEKKLVQSLNEALILVTGGQFLIGFAYRTFLEKSFEKLSSFSQTLKIISLTLLLISIGLLISTACFHRIVDREIDHDDLRRYVNKICSFALFPISISLGMEVYVVTTRVIGEVFGALSGILTSLTCLGFWYGLELVRKSFKERISMEVKDQSQDKGGPEEPTKLADQIDHMLTELRLVLPGVQALLGFQFAAMLMDGFDSLPTSSKYIHIGCMLLIGFSNVLLISPAAYHRIVENGEDTQELHRFGSRVFLISLLVLASGICGDFFIIIRKASGSLPLALGLALFMLIFFYSLWFGYTFYRLKKVQRGKSKA